MIGSEKVREARKNGQTARLAAKKKMKGSEYAKWFAALPQQILKAAHNSKIRDARQEQRDAIEALQIAEITGDGLIVAQERTYVSGLVVNKLVAAKSPGATVSLTTAGSGST